MKTKPLFTATGTRHRGDCAVACLASILRIPYVEVLVVAASINPKVLVGGLNNDDMIHIAEKFGHTLVEHSREEIDLRKMVGILGAQLRGNKGTDEHAVIMTYGLVFDPEGGDVWKARDYLRRYEARKIDLLELED